MVFHDAPPARTQEQSAAADMYIVLEQLQAVAEGFARTTRDPWWQIYNHLTDTRWFLRGRMHDDDKRR